MTVSVRPPNETESLILPLQRTFYPTRIPTQHQQLKNFISTSDPAIIYYASGNEVYALHKSTRKKELIASLRWTPQCLDAAHGWVCVGGPDGGACAFIFVSDEGTSAHGQPTRPHSEVDALLPLDLDPESRMLDQHSYIGNRRPTAPRRRKPEVQYNEMGTSIVNSVTIYRLRSGAALLDEIIVLVTNNDQTVRIYSLTQSRVLCRLDFPTPMNHATLSPDQDLLVAVGDEPRAFFCKKISLQGFGESTNAGYEWLEIAGPKLSLADANDACFTTAWSPSGHVCAVASQSGVITIFDTSRIVDDLEEDEAVIGVLKSSRPVLDHDFCGAVRSMSFAPEPWDMLAWAEDQGRVCVIDLRGAFQSRQTIELETDSPSLNRAIMVDADIDDDTAEHRRMEIEARFLRQEARDSLDNPAAINRTADYLELAARRTAQRRRHAHLEDGSALDEFRGELSESERQTLEAVGRSRLPQDHQPGTGIPQRNPYSMTYSQAIGTNSTSRQSNPSTTTGSTSGSAQASRQAESIREYIRQRSEQQTDRTRTGGTRSFQPRRRSSVVISNTNVNNQSSSSHPSSLAPIGTATPTLSASPSRLPSTTVPSGSTNTTAPPTFSAMGGDPWQTISDAMLSTAQEVMASTAAPEVARQRRDREYEEARARILERQASQQRPSSDSPSRYDRLLRGSNPSQALDSVRALAREGVLDRDSLELARIEARMEPDARYRPAWRSRRELDGGVRTMGVGWSRDGRNLYVATEEGILEYTVNLDNRKTFPAMALQ